MKILVVVPDSNIGGITSAAVNFCNELTRRGNQVILLDMSGRFLCAERLDANVVRALLKGKSQYWNLQADTLKKAKGLKKLKYTAWGIIKKITIRSGFWYKLIFNKYQEYGEFDVAVAFRQCDSCYSFVLNKVKAKRKIGFVHGELKGMGNISSWKRHMLKFDKIAYVSDAVREEFLRAYPELSNNALTIYNMLDVEAIKKRAQEECDKLFDKHKVNIVTVSRVDNEHKKIQRIAPICKKLKEEGIVDFSWYVIGDGPDYRSCVQQANDMGVTDVLHFCGAKENPYPYIVQADFTVLTSWSEAFGLVVAESLILGKPVVACEYPALKELLEDNITGVIVPQDDKALYCAVRKMIEDIERRTKLSTYCLKYKYLNDKAYQQFLSVL